jgi:hypothetical protein
MVYQVLFVLNVNYILIFTKKPLQVYCNRLYFPYPCKKNTIKKAAGSRFFKIILLMALQNKLGAQEVGIIIVNNFI